MSENISPQTDNEPKTSDVDTSPKPSTSGQTNVKEEEISVSSEDSETQRSAKRLGDLIHFVIAISVAMAIVVLYVKFVCVKDCRFGTHPLVIYREKETDSHSKRTFLSLANALVIIIVVAIMTFFIVALFYFRLEKFMIGFLIISIISTSFILFGKCFVDLLQKFNIPFDRIVAYLLIWNYTVMAICAIFWKGPKIVQQTALILLSATAAIIMIGVLPEWTTWALLMALVVWDLIAVLCPYGPLNILVATYKKRAEEEDKEALPPGLLYSTMIWMLATNENTELNSPKPDVQSEQINTEAQEVKQENKEEKKSKKKKKALKGGLGLGDFVFYSVLMGKVTIYGDFNLIAGCYVAIVFGFILTSILLVVFKRALPALPISITMAVIVFFMISLFTKDYLNQLSIRLIYV